MDLEVYWTNFAESRLEDVFNYYKNKAGLQVARKLTKGIVDITIDLQKNPRKGQREPLLEKYSREFRYLVYKKYKIIYFINFDKGRIDIVNVFDCRQNPTKMEIKDDNADEVV